MERLNVDQEMVNACVTDLLNHLVEKIDEKGPGAFHSPHEAYGVVAEEVHEALQALHENSDDKFQHEMLDIAVAAFWAIVSRRAHDDAEADKAIAADTPVVVEEVAKPT